jgi:mannose-6-phosphate isomerase-like protein (cupin superfamily)
VARFELDGPDGLSALRAATGEPYLEFLCAATMSAGLYVLPAGATDDQTPHAEDELYVVLRGSAVLEVGGEDRPVGPGSTVYVARGVEHRFHSIGEELAVMVVFAPPETA